MGMKTIDWIAVILLIIGGINWGLVGFFEFNIISYVTTGIMILERIIYGVVGVASVYSIYSLFIKR